VKNNQSEIPIKPAQILGYHAPPTKFPSNAWIHILTITSFAMPAIGIVGLAMSVRIRSQIWADAVDREFSELLLVSASAAIGCILAFAADIAAKRVGRKPGLTLGAFILNLLMCVCCALVYFANPIFHSR